MAQRTTNDIVKGSKLMLFYNNAPIGFATSHQLSMNTEVTTVSTKDSGLYPSNIAQSISWEVTAENLYSDAGEQIYMAIMKNMEPVDIVFAKASNWNDAGIMDSTATDWTFSAGTTIASGKALITSYSINAPAGDNATMSVTFTGDGPLNMVVND